MSIDWDTDDLDSIFDSDESYKDLIRALQRKKGFGLFFATFESADDIQQAKIKLAAELPQVATLTVDTANLYDRINQFLLGQDIKILLVDGFDKLFQVYGKNSSDLTSVPSILNHLNQQRERFRDTFQFSMVFLLNRKSIDYFIVRCPDFYDWRSGTYFL